MSAISEQPCMGKRLEHESKINVCFGQGGGSSGLDFDAGTGAGAIALNFGNVVGDKGQVYTYEIREDFAEIAKRNIDNFGIKNIEVKNQDIKDEATLAGKVVATQSGGGTIEDYLDGKPEVTGKFKEFKKYADYMSAFMDLENGRIDAVVCYEIIGRYYMQKHPNKLEAIDVTVGPSAQFGVGFRKDDKELRDKVQKALDEMRKDGTMAKISEKWFGADITKIDKK